MSLASAYFLPFGSVYYTVTHVKDSIFLQMMEIKCNLTRASHE